MFHLIKQERVSNSSTLSTIFCSGTIDDPKRPIKSLALLFKIDKEGVIEQVVTLPDEVNDIQLRFGFEGVTVDDDEDHVIVAFQRAW